MPLVPIMPISGANRCMLPPRPREQPVARPNSSAIKLGRRHALGQRVPVAAMRAEDRVVAVRGAHDARGDRLLADVGVAGAVDQAALMTAGQLLFGLANELHGAIQIEQRLAVECAGAAAAVSAVSASDVLRVVTMVAWLASLGR